MANSTSQPDRHAVSWRHVLCAPLLYAFQQTITLSPALAQNAFSAIENPLLYFVGYLAVALTACVACVMPGARQVVRRTPVAVVLLILVLGTLAMVIQALQDVGSPVLRATSGACVGLASSLILLRWYVEFARLDLPVLVRTAASSFAVAYGMSLVLTVWLHGIVASLVSTLVAVFVSAVGLELVGRTEASKGCDPAETAASEPRAPVRTLACWWPFLAAAFVAYSITGFSWGNALFGRYEYFGVQGAWLGPVGSCLGAAVVLAAAGRGTGTGRDVPRWPLPVSVGLLLVSWLLLVTLGQDVAPLTSAASGVAFGMLNPLLFSWAGVASRRNSADPVVTGALSHGAALLPIALGILLAPLLQGEFATLVSPLAGVAFFILFQLDTATRPRPEEGWGPTQTTVPSCLSSRERDVFALLAQGHSSTYIAERLGVSVHTVKTHVKHIYAKLGVHTKDEFLMLVSKDSRQAGNSPA